ncbi:MAG: hypothetical protein A2293_00720 [Elusimicrobia bacterium RIFOXYB2_FULL_49_7]|nr:MAG: hypothetical protein A2293_00720 [Elusimicrobia bacterium RIFOXYB2_FULL_49_7]
MKNKDIPEVHFADIAVSAMESGKTLPAKFRRLLKQQLDKQIIDKKRIGIKMHFGSQLGFSTIHPLFIRILVEELKEAGARHIKIMDNHPADGIPRGYTREVLGCDVVSTFGATRKYLKKEKIGFKSLDFVEFGGEALDSDFFICLSHVKGHGDCGFGGAIKNIAMGVVPGESRSKLHHLEGGIAYDPKKCTLCMKCIKHCPNGAISKVKDKNEIAIFFHHCTYCQHCVMVCPEKALKMENRRFEDFSEGMALVTRKFLNHFQPQNLLFINVLLDITMFCDCWGLTTPNLVPDIGILLSHNITSIERASLDLIQKEPFLKKGLPKGRKRLKGKGHLFERIHGKDPYRMITALEKGLGHSAKYLLKPAE